MRDRDFKVAVVGGGICGLSCAVFLQNAGVEVDIFEAAAGFSEIGAGVGLGPNAVRALDGLGVLDAVLARADQPLGRRSFKVLSGDDVSQFIYDYPTTAEDLGLGLHRPAFLDALLSHFDDSKAHFNKRCVSVTQENSLNWTDTHANGHQCCILFEDGTEVYADVILGCDGVRSPTRSAVKEPAHKPERANATELAATKVADPIFTRTVAYRGLVPSAELTNSSIELDTSRPSLYCGRGRHIILFPIQGGRLMNIVAFVQNKHGDAAGPSNAWVSVIDREEMLGEFAEFDVNLRNLLAKIQHPARWSIFALDPPKTYVDRRIALLGDAAHAMLPHLGAGAGQALEDALVMCKLLVSPFATKSTIPNILRAYDAARRPRANAVITASAAAGDVYDGYGPSGQDVAGLRKDLEGIWSSVWHHDLSKDIQNALKEIEQYDSNI